MKDLVAPTAEVVDTTGAGDMLAGAFLALELARVPPLAALDAAVRIATASVEAFGVDNPKFRAAIASIATPTITQATASMRIRNNIHRLG
jgi:ribokinase